MKTVLMSVVMLMSVSAHAWWSPNEGIRVNCQVYDDSGVVTKTVRIEGALVKIETAGQVQTFQGRIYQTSDSKVWENSQFQVVVALVQSSWGTSGHVGNLTEKSKGTFTDTSLWCVPEIQN